MIHTQVPGKDASGRLRFQIFYRAQSKDPWMKIISGTVVGDEIHTATWSNPVLSPTDLEKLAEHLNDLAKLVRHHQNDPPTEPDHPTNGPRPVAG